MRQGDQIPTRRTEGVELECEHMLVELEGTGTRMNL